MSFRFQVVRAWELAAEDVMRAGVGFLPLAVLGTPPPGQTRVQALAGLAERIADRAAAENEAEAGKIVKAAFLLSTMHVEARIARDIFTRVTEVEDLPGYLLIQEEGAIKFARDIILQQGHRNLGVPTEKQVNRLNAIEDVDRLKRLVLRVTTASSWDALLRVK